MAPQIASSSILLRHVRVFDGVSTGEPTSVLVVDDRIEAIGPELESTGQQVMEGHGNVLLPGLIDAHVHLHEVGNLAQLAQAGVTTALDMACWPPELVADLRGRRGVTDIRSAGIPATAPGTTHSKMPGRPASALVAEPGEAEAFVQARLDEGSDYIKLIADVPGPDQATLDALVAAAHRHDRLTVAHAATLEPFQMALSAGADIITHAPLNAVLDDATIQSMVARSTVSVPTLTMMEAVATKFFGSAEGDEAGSALPAGPGFANATRSVRLLHSAGVPILAGTDANASAGAPASVPHGESLHRELELLVAAGLSPAEAIAAATHLAARHFGLADRGAIAPGLRADLILVAGDPLVDITDSRHVERVWCAGVEYEA